MLIIEVSTAFAEVSSLSKGGPRAAEGSALFKRTGKCADKPGFVQRPVDVGPMLGFLHLREQEQFAQPRNIPRFYAYVSHGRA